jgi:hypothetical protein
MDFSSRSYEIAGSFGSDADGRLEIGQSHTELFEIEMRFPYETMALTVSLR